MTEVLVIAEGQDSFVWESGLIDSEALTVVTVAQLIITTAHGGAE
jgi:hypothetical protein